MSDILIMGSVTPGNLNNAASYVLYHQFTALYNASVYYISVYCLVDSNVRVAIYTNDSDKPKTLLVESASTAITKTGWRNIYFASPYPVVQGTIYWLASNCQTNGGASYSGGSGLPRYCNQSHAYGAFPASASGGTVYTIFNIAMGAYGMLPTGAPVCFDMAVV